MNISKRNKTHLTLNGIKQLIEREEKEVIVQIIENELVKTKPGQTQKYKYKSLLQSLL